MRWASTPTCSGRLLEAAGLKGTRRGGAEISSKHANFIVNKGNATCKNVLDLIHLVTKKVKEHSGIELESEVRYIPYK